jgi:hypothetical protein
MTKQKKQKKKNVNRNKVSSTATVKPKFSIAPWLMATIVIFLIVFAAHKEYISSLISQILLVLTVVVFSVYQRTRKKNG